jgi:hypothetical protein
VILVSNLQRADDVASGFFLSYEHNKWSSLKAPLYDLLAPQDLRMHLNAAGSPMHEAEHRYA